MEAICERKNMKSAIKCVIKNKGAPGVDGMTVRKIKRYLKRQQAGRRPSDHFKSHGFSFPWI